MQTLIAQHPSRAAIVSVVSDIEGRRLEAYVRSRWDRDKGGIRGLADTAGISADALYKWFRGDSEPSLEALGQLASALGVKRHELVAVLDGERSGTDVVRLLGPESREELIGWLAMEIRKRIEDEA